MPRHGRKSQKGSYGLTRLWDEGKNLPRLSKTGVFFQLYLQGWRNLFKSPLNSVLTVATISVSLLLFGGFVLLLENARDLLVSTQDSFRMNLFLKDEVYEGERNALIKEIEADPGVDSVVFRSKDDALTDFRKTLGECSSLLEGLDVQNPLPAALELKFKRAQGAERHMSAFKEKMEGRKEIEKIQYRQGTISQVVSLLRILRIGGLFAVLFMFVMTGFIIANTIKLGLLSHTDEIRVMRLVGATEGYVKLPFVIEACVQGVLGGFISVALVYGVYQLLRSLVQQSPLLTYLIPNFHFLSLSAVVLVIFTGIGVGICGSYFAVRRSIPGEE